MAANVDEDVGSQTSSMPRASYKHNTFISLIYALCYWVGLRISSIQTACETLIYFIHAMFTLGQKVALQGDPQK